MRWILLSLLLVSPLHAEWRLESSARRPTASSGVAHWVLSVRDQESLQMHLVKLDRSKTALKVVPLASRETVADAAKREQAVAAINGGYFQADGRPLGLVVSNGVTLHPRQQSKILTGIVAVTPKGTSLFRNAELRANAPVRQALQAGPYLVDKGVAVAGLNATRAAERTVVIADKAGVTALLVTHPITLADLGKLLSTPGILPGIKVERALNLDGGSSTALWVNAEPAPFSRGEWKPVKNAVVVVPKETK